MTCSIKHPHSLILHTQDECEAYFTRYCSSLCFSDLVVTLQGTIQAVHFTWPGDESLSIYPSVPLPSSHGLSLTTRYSILKLVYNPDDNSNPICSPNEVGLLKPVAFDLRPLEGRISAITMMTFV